MFVHFVCDIFAIFYPIFCVLFVCLCEFSQGNAKNMQKHRTKTGKLKAKKTANNKDKSKDQNVFVRFCFAFCLHFLCIGFAFLAWTINCFGLHFLHSNVSLGDLFFVFFAFFAALVLHSLFLCLCIFNVLLCHQN